MDIFNLRTIYILFLLLFGVLSAYFLLIRENARIESPVSISREFEPIQSLTNPASQELKLQIPDSYVISQRAHVYQTFNNCGPATLSMALSYWGIDLNQKELGDILRPYQVAGGNNDDKSVTLKEVANQAVVYGLHAYLRPNGTFETIEKFISQDIPVVARTWTKVGEDIGHYRIVRGYDKTAQEIIQDDSLQGENTRYSYSEFNAMWRPFNYEYLILADESKKDLVEAILGEELDEKAAWQNALVRIENEIARDPDNWHLIFAKSRIYYYLGEYEKSVGQFEEVENKLSFRTLWYQIEPIYSYFELGDYDRVFEITSRILNNENRAFSELYIIRGNIYKNQGNIDATRAEYEKAVFYNSNFTVARSALNSL